MKVVEYVIAHKVELASIALFVWSEVLGTSEKYKNSSIYTLVVDVLKKIAGK